MSTSGSGSASTSQPRLGPAWRSTSSGGRGFQPPSAASDPADETKNSNRNSFSLLDDDENAAKKGDRSSRITGSPKRTFASRSEGLRSSGVGTGGFSSRSASKGGSTGRSLADLVNRFPSSENPRPGPSGVRSHRSGSGDDGNTTTSTSRSSMRDFVDDKKVIRFTREKLLSMRPRTDKECTRPEALAGLEGTSLLSKEPLDPVCWDNFDAEEIWNLAKERRASKAASTGMPSRREPAPEPGLNRRSSSSGGGGGDSWVRGVALPPGGDNSSRRGGRYESDDPDDLWDDPMSATEAAADFSAFGGSLDDAPKTSGGDTFDLAQMAEAAKKFDEEVRGEESNGDQNGHDYPVNPTAPLASAGTTIRSGSGDDVNVFEDFDAPPVAEEGANTEPIRSGDDQQSASSRLMQMIGVSSGDDKASGDAPNAINDVPTESSIFPGFGASSSVPSNPWGAPAPEPKSEQAMNGGGLDLSAKLREARQVESKKSEIEMLKKQKEEEEKRRLALIAQQQAEAQAQAQARQAAMQSQQQSQQPEYSQVELILTERISTVLENSWGRSDLMTILQTLHNDDARVVPLLGTVDALRALIVRHPRRFALTKDPTFGAEMAVLVMNNSQWQQQKASEEMQRRQQEEEHQKMLLAKEAEARAKAEAEARASEIITITNAPWYYADPQGNIQGPFGGEEMRQWLAAGYFKGDLPISQNQNGGFRALSTLFPDLSTAFKPTGPSEEEKAKIAEMEARAAAEAAASAEAEARKRAEMEARAAAEAEAQRRAEMQKNQNQSVQLKMMLGLGGTVSNEVAGLESVQNMSDTMNANEHPSSNSAERDEEPAPQSRPATSKAKKNQPPKAEQKSVSVSVPAAAPAPSPAAPPAWGGAGTSKSQSKNKSMSEIQKEEARVAAQIAKQRKASQPTGGGGWAGIAASGGSTAWSGNAVKNVPSGHSSSNMSSSARHNRAAGQMTKTSGNNQGSSSRSSTQQTLEDFGANDKMTPVLESWCKEQMKKLNGSEDLTLVAFCMTLTDPVEIKQYLTAYLGSTSQVNNFASEFINRKNGTKQQEQWETTSSSKKGRKKKGSA